MNFMDGLLITLINTVVCTALPKVLSVITAKSKIQEPSKPVIQSPESGAEISGVMDAA